MKKEDLMKLGLTDEVADKVVQGFAEELKSYIPKARFDEVNTQKNEYEKQMKDYMKKLEDLTNSTKSFEEIQKQMTELKSSYEKEKAEYENKLKETRLSSALRVALNGKVHDIDIVGNLVDKTKIELDDNGNIKGGLDDQLEALKKSKSFLFVPEQPQSNPNPTPPIRQLGGDGGNPGQGAITDLRQAIAASLIGKQNN